MRWRDNRQSKNVEDRRGTRVSGSGSGGAGGMLKFIPIVYKVLGFKGTAVAALGLLAYGMFSGTLPQMLSGGSMGGETSSSQTIQESSAEKETAKFISVVLADTEDTWKKIFSAKGLRYEEPKLVLFRNKVKSGCGYASAQTGPFYCPADKKAYIDLSFYDDLKNRFKAPGDFAQAYVLAHEVGHHVQNLLGTSGKVQRAKQSVSKIKGNHLSVMLELQADCYAGIWANEANRSRQILEAGDVEEALNAATVIGDDHLQKQAKGHVNPDSFTHGSSKQRVKWFNVGLKTGTLASCDTFNAKNL